MEDNNIDDAPPEYCLIDPNSAFSKCDSVSVKEKDSKDTLPTEPILHFIKKGESLSGLSIKYQVDKGHIRSLNRMATDELAGYQTLWIPTCLVDKIETPSSEAKRKERLIARFRCLTKCLDSQEARFYLEDKDFDLEVAVSTYLEDLNWENSHPLPSSSSTKPPSFFIGLFKGRTRNRM